MSWRTRARAILPLASGAAWVQTTRLSHTVETGSQVRAISRPRIRFAKGAEIRIGDRAVLNSSPVSYHTAMPSRVTLIADRPDAVIRIGPDCRINGATIHAQAAVTIGARVLMAAGSTIMDSNGHPLEHYGRHLKRDAPRPVTIEDDVWIGLGAVILPGSRVGRGSVVSANAVVSGFVPPHSIVRSSMTISDIVTVDRNGHEDS